MIRCQEEGFIVTRTWLEFPGKKNKIIFQRDDFRLVVAKKRKINSNNFSLDRLHAKVNVDFEILNELGAKLSVRYDHMTDCTLTENSFLIHEFQYPNLLFSSFPLLRLLFPLYSSLRRPSRIEGLNDFLNKKKNL